jgi:hypothetical protein
MSARLLSARRASSSLLQELPLPGTSSSSPIIVDAAPPAAATRGVRAHDCAEEEMQRLFHFHFHFSGERPK